MLSENDKKMMDDLLNYVEKQLDKIFTPGDSQKNVNNLETEPHNPEVCKCATCVTVEEIEMRIAVMILEESIEYMQIKQTIQETKDIEKLVLHLAKLNTVILNIKQSMAQIIHDYIAANLSQDILRREIDKRKAKL